MDWGDPEHTPLGDVDHTLKSDDPITARVLSAPTATSPHVRFGLPVWNRPGWVGPLYALDASAGNYLPAYGRLFETVEVNSTFHYPVTPEVITTWVHAVPPTFRFCVKVWKNLSHDPAPRDADIERFLETARAFGDRLGLCFLQLPPTADLDWKRMLARLIDRLAPHFPLAIELRHPAWFYSEPTHTRLFAHLAERGIGLVITDTSGHREVVHMAVTAPFLLLRLRGDLDPPSERARADAWLVRLNDWLDRGLRQVYVIGHQPNEHELEALHFLTRISDGLATRRDLTMKAAPLPPQLSLL